MLYQLKSIQTTQKTKTSDQLSPSVVDLGTAPNCRYISCKTFSTKLPKIHFVWIFCGEIQVQSTQNYWENSKLYILFLIANFDTGRPGIPMLGKVNQRCFPENYLKISLPFLWGNLV